MSTTCSHKPNPETLYGDPQCQREQEVTCPKCHVDANTFCSLHAVTEDRLTRIPNTKLSGTLCVTHLREELLKVIPSLGFKAVEDSLLSGLCGHRDCDRDFSRGCAACSRLYCEEHSQPVHELSDAARRLTVSDDDHLCIHCNPTRTTKNRFLPSPSEALSEVVKDSKEHADTILIKAESIYKKNLDITIGKAVDAYKKQLDITKTSIEELYEDQLQKTKTAVSELYKEQLENTRQKVDAMLVQTAVKVGFAAATSVALVLFSTDVANALRVWDPAAQGMWPTYRVVSFALSSVLLFCWIVKEGLKSHDEQTKTLTIIFMIVVATVAVGFLSLTGVF